MLVVDGQFLLLIEVPIQDRAQQLQIYEIFNLPVPHGNVLVKYKISDKYIGTTYDETQAVVINTATVLNMPPCKWKIFQNRCTISISHKSTYMHSSPKCQEWPGNRSTVLPVCISYTSYIPIHYDHIKPVDLHFNTHHTRISHNNDLPS